MPSKKKGKKRKSAYKRGEKLAILLKRGTILLLAIAVVSAVVLGLKLIASKFTVEKIVVSGTYHIDKNEMLDILGINMGSSLVDLQCTEGVERLMENPWIKNVAIRKQYPHTLILKVDEAVPKALLSLKRRLYLLDEEGVVLEKIKGETEPFLPVIKNINPKNRKDLAEALALVGVLTGDDGLIERDSIEIGVESYGLTAHIDGDFIKVGYGSYEEKFERWMELEPEIRRKGVPIKYVDLRFKDSVIIKPLKDLRGERSS